MALEFYHNCTLKCVFVVYDVSLPLVIVNLMRATAMTFILMFPAPIRVLPHNRCSTYVFELMFFPITACSQWGDPRLRSAESQFLTVLTRVTLNGKEKDSLAKYIWETPGLVMLNELCFYYSTFCNSPKWSGMRERDIYFLLVQFHPSLFFFFFNLFILFIFGCVGSSFLCEGFL